MITIQVCTHAEKLYYVWFFSICYYSITLDHSWIPTAVSEHFDVGDESLGSLCDHDIESGDDKTEHLNFNCNFNIHHVIHTSRIVYTNNHHVQHRLWS